jgi:hypothetical protein
MSRAIDHVCVTIYNAFLVAGTAWLVWHGWSPWWFAAALLFMSRSSPESE